MAAVGDNDPVTVEAEIATGVVGRVVDHDQVGVAAGQWEVGKAAEIHIAIDVAIDDEERRVAEQRQGGGDAAGRFQGARRFG